MAPHSSTLAWKIPWTEEPGRLQSMGVAEGRTRLSDFTFTFHFHALEKGNGNPLQCSCLETPRDVGAWWAAVYGVAQSLTRLKRLSSSSSSSSIRPFELRGWRRGEAVPTDPGGPCLLRFCLCDRLHLSGASLVAQW